MRPHSVTLIDVGTGRWSTRSVGWGIVEIDRHGVGPPHLRTGLSDDDGSTYSQQKSGRRGRPIPFARRPACPSGRVLRAFHSASFAAPEQSTSDYRRCPCRPAFSCSCCLRPTSPSYSCATAAPLSRSSLPAESSSGGCGTSMRDRPNNSPREDRGDHNERRPRRDPRRVTHTCQGRRTRPLPRS